MARKKARDEVVRQKTSSPTTTTGTSAEPLSSSSNLKRRPPFYSEKLRNGRPTLDGQNSSQDESDPEEAAMPSSASWTSRNQWVVFAIASGACAAFNGVFAKLTTNDLTSHLSNGIAVMFGLETAENIIEIIVRVIFFSLNLVFNGVMWTMFTKALARGNSTTQVSIMNTSSNFMITALLGLVIFAESLPPLWWLGASMLVAGNVIIGRKDEGSKADDDDDDNAASVVESGGIVASYSDVPQEGVLHVEKDDEDEDVALIGDVNVEAREHG